MSNRYIYVFASGSVDRARWLHISRRENGNATLHLADLCHPGQVSSIGQVMCPWEFLLAALSRNTVQITAEKGYVVLRRNGDILSLEFRGTEDGAPCKVNVRVADVLERIASLEGVPDRELTST